MRAGDLLSDGGEGRPFPVSVLDTLLEHEHFVGRTLPFAQEASPRFDLRLRGDEGPTGLQGRRGLIEASAGRAVETAECVLLNPVGEGTSQEWSFDEAGAGRFVELDPSLA